MTTSALFSLLMRLILGFTCLVGLSGCLSTIPHTTAKSLPAGRVIVEPYAGILTLTTPHLASKDDDTVPAAGGGSEPTVEEGDPDRRSTGSWLGISTRVGLAERADLGLTLEWTGLVLDLKVELLDRRHFALALDAGGGIWGQGLVQGRIGLLADGAVGPMRATAGLHYARMLGAVSPRILSPTLAIQLAVTDYFALVPQATGYLSVGKKDSSCSEPETGDLNDSVHTVMCEASQSRGFALTLGLRFSFGRPAESS